MKYHDYDVVLTRKADGERISYTAQGGYLVRRAGRAWVIRGPGFEDAVQTLDAARECIASEWNARRDLFRASIDGSIVPEGTIVFMGADFGIRVTFAGFEVTPQEPLPLRTVGTVEDMVAYMTICAQFLNGLEALDR